MNGNPEWSWDGVKHYLDEQTRQREQRQLDAIQLDLDAEYLRDI